MVCIAVGSGGDGGDGGGVICGACWISMCYFPFTNAPQQICACQPRNYKRLLHDNVCFVYGFVCAKSLHKQANASIIFKT